VDNARIDTDSPRLRRPGELERTAEGFTAKVLNERLVKLVRFGILEKESYSEIPLRVEYNFTAFGQRFMEIFDQIELTANRVQG